MAFNNNDHLQHFEQFLQSWEDEMRSMQHTVKRLKSHEGIPIANIDQLGNLDPQAGEDRFVKKVFDRFTPRLRDSKPLRKS